MQTAGREGPGLVKVLIADDHPLLRAGLISVLAAERSIQVVGEAASVDEAMRLIAECQPDIALVDPQLGSESSFAWVLRCKVLAPACRFIILTASTERADFMHAVKEGIDGYILQRALPEEILHTIRIVSKGRRYYDPSFIQEDSHAGSLTPKETEVLRALGQGLSNREIATHLFITEYTVKKHVSQILYKLHLADRTQAALWAHAHGLAKY
jgi:DNA-binding NarL/FixJ family response regulator